MLIYGSPGYGRGRRLKEAGAGIQCNTFGFIPHWSKKSQSIHPALPHTHAENKIAENRFYVPCVPGYFQTIQSHPAPYSLVIITLCSRGFRQLNFRYTSAHIEQGICRACRRIIPNDGQRPEDIQQIKLTRSMSAVTCPKIRRYCIFQETSQASLRVSGAAATIHSPSSRSREDSWIREKYTLNHLYARML